MFGRSKKSDVIFDEIVPDAVGHRFDYLERPVNHFLFVIFQFFVVFLVLATLIRLVYLNQVRGAFYRDRSLTNVTREVRTPAPRGLIVDRFGEPLVENIPTFSVVLNLTDFFRLPSNGPGETQQFTLDQITSILSVDRQEIVNSLSSVNLERQGELIISKNVDLDKAVALRGLDLESIFIIDDYRRHYLNPFAFSHLLGYTGEVTQEDLLKDPTLDLGDEIGKNGLEFQYDSYLRGTKGSLVDFQDVRGASVEDRQIGSPEPGQTLKLTIDGELQAFFYERFQQALDNLGRDAGVGLAFNPKTGEILAALSFPSFNSNAFSDDSSSLERSSLLTASHRPLFNRFVQGIYNPGSSIKPLVAVAALKEGVVEPSDIFYSKGYIELPNPYHPENPSRFLDWKPQGWVDVYSALARSSNVYFYYVGGGFEDTAGLGIDKLNEWWRKFGLDSPTGIDLPGETAGFLPNPDEKEIRTGTPWRIGDTYNVSIGQGDLAITPLELLNYIAAISNDGVAYRPFLSLSHNSPEILYDLSELYPEIKEVQKGMVDTVIKPYGTANLLVNLPVSVAAKTGSAQIAGNTKTNAFFVGYAPAQDPEIAILILVEDAKEGSLNAVPIAKEVFYWYATNRLNKFGE